MFKIKVETIQPVQVNIADDSTTPNFQQGLVLRQKQDMLRMVNLSGDRLDQKAGSIVQLSGLIVALVGVLSIPGFIIDTPTGWVKAAIAFGFVIFILMIGFSILAWQAQDYELPGDLDWDQIHDRYIWKENEACFDQILSDYLESIQVLKDRNIRKARFVNFSFVLLIVQVGGLMVIALLA